MRTGTLVVALTVSGVLGGIAGALLVQGLPVAATPAAPSPGHADAGPAKDPAVEKELAALRARLDEMQASVASSADETGRLRQDLEQERKASTEAREKLASLESAPGALRFPGTPPGPGAPGMVSFAAPATLDPALQVRWKRVQDLRAMPEEDRWAAAREALGLTMGQEEELKAALKERDQLMKDAMKVETREVKGPDGTTSQAISIAMPDMEKVRDSRRKYDDRVSSALNAEQSKKWREEGYEQALSGPMMPVMGSLRMDIGGGDGK